MSAKVIITGEFERLDEDDFSGVVIPFEVTQINGETVIRSCTELKSVAFEFASRFDGLEFTPEAKKWIECAAASFLESNRLERSDECGNMIILKFSGRNSADKRIINTQALPFNPGDRHENLTSFDLDLIAELGIPAYVAIDGNKIVSAAVGSPCEDGADSMEIGVETAEGYCGHGLATGCVHSLALELWDRKIDAIYLAQEDNPASVSVARGAGFIEYGNIFQLICCERGP